METASPRLQAFGASFRCMSEHVPCPRGFWATLSKQSSAHSWGQLLQLFLRACVCVRVHTSPRGTQLCYPTMLLIGSDADGEREEMKAPV